MKLVPFTHTRPIQYRDVEDGFGKEVIPSHPVRPAREWEMCESWLEEVADDGDKQGAD
jgi:hypothetical protein